MFRLLTLVILPVVCVLVMSRTGLAAEVPRFGLFEVTFTSDETFENSFWDPVVSAEFTAPDGRKIKVAGFYDGGKAWKVRFAPGALGEWHYVATMGGKAKPQEKKGTFTCVKGKSHGFLRISKKNPRRFEYDDGAPFYGIGYQTGGLLSAGLDGGKRADGWKTVPIEEYLQAMDGACNLRRIQLACGNPEGCALLMMTEEIGLDRYHLDNAKKLDRALTLGRRYNVSHYLILFQDMSLWANPKTVFGRGRTRGSYKRLTAKNLPEQERYLRYIVARYAALVDVWELFNEDVYATDDYLAHLAKVIREADPYDRPITTNYERPEQDWCEIVCPHEYMSISAEEVDGHLLKEFNRLKAFGKPVQYTEFGNKGSLSNYDPVKWRIVVWTCYTREVGMLFWSMSGVKTVPNPKPRGNANMYLGPESRKSFRVLMDLVRDLPVDMKPIMTGFHNHDVGFRIGGLGNGEVFVIYVHHFADHAKAAKPRPLGVWTGPGRFKVTWIDPATGKVIDEFTRATRSQILTVRVPEMTIDAACKIARVKNE